MQKYNKIWIVLYWDIEYPRDGLQLRKSNTFIKDWL